MSDYEFSDASDYAESDAEAEQEEYVSDFEDDEVPLPDRQSKCQKNRYESASGIWSATPLVSVDTFPRYNSAIAEPKENNSEADLFGCFLSVGIIVKHTNEELQAIKKKVERKGVAKSPPLQPTNEDEIKALLGLRLNLGISGFKGVSVHYIFSTESGSHSRPAHLTFSRDRYHVLFRAVRFDNKLLRQKKDKLAPIREVFEKFMANCKENYEPGEFVTVDETLVGFRGRCSFRMFIPSKAVKFGIKIWTCVDSHSKYLHNAEIYLGKQGGARRVISIDTRILLSTIDVNFRNLGMEAVNRLTRELTDAGRTIVCDNFFTSPELGQSLWQKNTCLLGTVRSNRKGMPKEFVKEELEVQNTKYAYKKQESLMKLQVANNMSVFLYSTFHHRAAFNKKAKKPVVVSDYNKAKCGVDQFDEMTKHFSYSPATRRWPLKIMLWLLNVRAMNAWVLHQKQTKLVNADAGKRRSFLFSLSKQLMEVQQQNHSRSENYLNAEFRKIAEANANIEKKVRGNLPSPAFWCPICKTTKRKSVECQKCRRQICIDDVVQMVHCKDCQTHSPPRKVAAVPAKAPTTRSQTQSAKPKVGRCALCPTNQKVNSAQRCKLCDNPMCPLHRSAANNLFCLRCG